MQYVTKRTKIVKGRQIVTKKAQNGGFQYSLRAKGVNITHNIGLEYDLIGFLIIPGHI